MKAYDTYPDSHNFYGDFHDLDAARIEDVRAFYEKYYAPNNAVMAITGDVKAGEVFTKVEKYFASVPRRDVPPLLKVERRSRPLSATQSKRTSWQTCPPWLSVIACPIAIPKMRSSVQ